MTQGIRIKNAAGQISFDSSRLGGVVLTAFSATYASNTTTTYTYNIPFGSNIVVVVTPNSSAFRYDLWTTTVSISSGVATVSLSPGNLGVANVPVNVIILVV
jgi:hypothetical protein